ncbi:MAG: hypothetical protein KJT01_12470 [Gemmatimonadetes bacterium]|nr:hypothetical protein [Gemmatimonadota bacterium]
MTPRAIRHHVMRLMAWGRKWDGAAFVALLLVLAAPLPLEGQARPAPPGDPASVREGDPRDRAAWLWGTGNEPPPPPGHLFRVWQAEQAAAPAFRLPPLFRPGMPNVFTPLGPTALLGNNSLYGSLPQADGGRVAAVAAHPTDEHTMWIGTASGGIWRTADGGLSWEVTSDNLCGLTIGAITVNPVRPATVYAASGEPVESRAQSCGVFRSSDGGATWTNLGGSVLAQRAVYAIHLVRSSAAQPDGAAVLLLATDAGMLRSTNGGGAWVTVAEGTFTDVVGHPTNGSMLWGWKNSGTDGGLWRSADAGLTWARVFAAPAAVRGELAVTPAAPDRVWALYAKSDGTFGGLYRHDGATGTGTALAARGVLNPYVQRIDFGRQSWYNLAIAVDPSNASTILVAGVRAYRSTDGGGWFTEMAATVHVDWHALVFHPANPRRVYGGNDGGIFVSGDGGLTWASRNAGVSATLWYPGIAVHPTLPGAVLGGLQDNGTNYSGGRVVFEGVTGGDGGFTAFHPTNPDVIWTECQKGGFYGCLWKTTLNPATGVATTDGTAGSALYQASTDLDTFRALFIPPIAVGPRAASAAGYRLYAASHRLFTSDNEGVSWNPPTDDLTKGGSAGITAIAVAPGDATVVYVGTSDGNVRRSTDAGDTFAAASASLPAAYIGDIAVASNDPRHALATVQSYTTGIQLWATLDGGATWGNVTGNLPPVPARAVLRIPGSTRTFVGTAAGAFVAELPLTAPLTPPTWARVAGLPASVVVTDLVYQASTQTVVAATYGRGLWALLNASSAVTGLRGDVNRDGTVTAADALLIQRLLVGHAPQAGQATFPHGDANCDNRVTSADVLVTLRFAAGLGASGSCVNTIQ